MPILSTYSFLPWAKQGIASKISENDTLGLSDGTGNERASVKADLEIQYTGIDDAVQTTSISKDIKVVGPGDVIGFSEKNIVRVEPRNGVTNYEANGLPYLEFYEEDFLWRFTPASADNSNLKQTRLRPWLTLVVLKDEEFTVTANSNGLPFITVTQNFFDQAFPHQKDTWAFAHIHVNHRLTTLQGQTLQQEVSQELNVNPDVAVSRLLCSRKLLKNTGYTAFVIPSFETGRLAGLGLDITGVKAQAPSWKKGAMPASTKRPFDFPVYYQWRFRTANAGDFESLALLLKPTVIGPDSGKMPMDIHDPGFGLSAVNNGTKTIGMEAALKPPAFNRDKWPTDGGTVNPDDQNTVNKLKDLLNLSADLIDANAVITSTNPFFNSNIGEDPLLVPPIYGVWHALIQKLGDAANPAWINELNLDFRNRAAAGLGKKVVQQHQEDFMNRAWQQVNKVNEANQKIQEAALSKMVNISIFKKHVINAGNDKAIMLTNAVQHLIKNQAQKQTLQQDFVESRIPYAAKTAAFRKIVRPRTKVARANFIAQSSKGFDQKLVDTNKIIQFFNADQSAAGAVSAAKLKVAPISAIKMTSIQQTINQAVSVYQSNIPNSAKDEFVKLIEANVNGVPVSKTQLLQFANSAPITNAGVKTATVDMVNNISLFPVQKNTDGQVIIQFNDAKFKTLFGEGIHSKSYNDIILKDSTVLNTTDIKTLTTFNDIKEFQASVSQFSASIAPLPVGIVANPFSNIASLSKYIFEKLNPAVTLGKKLASTLKVLQNGVFVPLSQLKPVMAYPEFTESVYTYLLELSKNHILPNIDKLPANSITILENNQSFIEAFMVGMNHEMAREFLWREYPTDQRGSYFRQFWNVKDNLFPADNDPEKDKELKLDIKKINEWDQKLGSHSPRTKTANLVLVMRGDLLKKYPNTMVYAQQAAYSSPDPSQPRKLNGGIDATQTKFPLFKAEIDPDITLLGFDLDKDEARGERIENSTTSTVGKNPGWFFIMKERPGQVRFGLDDFVNEQGDDTVMPTGMPSTWDDLSWEHLVSSKTDLLNYHISFSKTVTITNPANQPVWNMNSADMAAILYQSPVLFARHAAEMLPEN